MKKSFLGAQSKEGNSGKREQGMQTYRGIFGQIPNI